MTRYAAVVLAVLLAACGGDGGSAGPTPSTSTAPSTSATATGGTIPEGTLFEVTVAGGKVVSGPGRRVRVERGELVRIRVTSDVADELHVHTYDLKADLAPGTASTLEFAATIQGVFEVELEKDHLLLFQLQVG